MGSLGRTVFVLFIFLQDAWVEISATTCSYISTSGQKRYVYCMQTCCEYTEDQTYSDICCAYDPREREFYIGAGMTTLILIGALALCFAHLCCKSRNQLPLQNTLQISMRTRIRPEDMLPTVSSQVQPVQPPPYEEYPLPDYPDEHGNTVNKENIRAYPNEPPPAYSPCDNLNIVSL